MLDCLIAFTCQHTEKAANEPGAGGTGIKSEGPIDQCDCTANFGTLVVSENQCDVGENTWVSTGQGKCPFSEARRFAMCGLRIFSVAVEPPPSVTHGSPR